VADIFVSYTSGDRDWAFWIGQELLKLGHAVASAMRSFSSDAQGGLPIADEQVATYRER
jgi:hypothetical protein